LIWSLTKKKNPKKKMFRSTHSIITITKFPSRISSSYLLLPLFNKNHNNNNKQLFSTTTNTNNKTTTTTTTITAAPERPTKRVTLHTLKQLKVQKTPITMVTAYDFPSAVHVDVADIDVLLVGDSVGMVEMGYDTTIPVTLDQMIHHCKAVSLGCHRPLLIGDLPFGTYEVDAKEAFRSAARILKEGGMDAVKMEGGAARVESIRSCVTGGIATMGHIGLTPQSFSALGGFRYQGRTADEAIRVTRDALAVQEAGAFALVIECVPPSVALEITKRLEIPTIGIGSGPHTDGQVLVYHDLLGMMQHPWHAQHALKFCKMYASVGSIINKALAEYREEVKSKTFPGTQYSPYTIPKEEEEKFMNVLHGVIDGERKAVGSTSSSLTHQQYQNKMNKKENDSNNNTSEDGAIYGGGGTNNSNKKR
jgi:3-methyl-2-oxobutanoate hydroxymethyltransferase